MSKSFYHMGQAFNPYHLWATDGWISNQEPHMGNSIWEHDASQRWSIGIRWVDLDSALVLLFTWLYDPGQVTSSFWAPVSWAIKVVNNRTYLMILVILKKYPDYMQQVMQQNLATPSVGSTDAAIITLHLKWQTDHSDRKPVRKHWIWTICSIVRTGQT